MNKYAQVIEQSVEKFNHEFVLVEQFVKNTMSLKMDKETTLTIFPDDYTFSNLLNSSSPVAERDLLHTFKKRLLERFWRNFFHEIKLNAELGDRKYTAVTEKYSLKHGRFYVDDMATLEFTVDNLTKFVDELS